MALVPNLFASSGQAALVLCLVKAPDSAASWVLCTQNMSITSRPELFCGVGRRDTAAPTERDRAPGPDLLSQAKEKPSLEDVIKLTN